MLKRWIAGSRLPFFLYLKWQRLQSPKIVAQTAKFWREARNRHAGRRGFVIGNGPSLRISDLAALENEITIASNKIYLAFDQVSWRPNYFSCADWIVWSKIQHEVPKRFKQPLLLSTFGLETFPQDGIMLRNLGLFHSGAEGFSFDSEKGQYGGYTVTYNNLQTAVHLGLNPIYLIGCDHYYQGEEDAKVEKALVAHSGRSNHFIANYRAPGEIVNMAPIREMNAAFECARRACHSAGIQILNATRGGHLDIFPRVDLDAVLADERRSAQ